MKIKILIAALTFLLIGFTVFIVLDTFVIPRGYEVDVDPADMFAKIQASTSDTPEQNGVETETAADDEKHPSVVTETPAQMHSSRGTWRGSDDEDDEDREGSNGSSNGGWWQSDDSSDNNRWGSGNFSDRSWWDSGSSRDYSSYSEELTITGEAENEYTYKDDNISITISLYTVNDSSVYAADIQLSSAVYLKTAFAKNSYGRNFTDATSDIAADNNAILAVNGDYYGARERGYVIRNGVVYRDSISDSDVLCVYVDGTMEIINPSEVTTQALVDKGVWQAFSFGPSLVVDGEVAVSQDEEGSSYMIENPRTAIGMIEPLHYVFVVSDGRSDASEGLSLYVLAEFMQSLGVTTAYNLDGGGSTTMVFQGEVINHPTSWGNNYSEREVSDIVYIG